MVGFVIFERDAGCLKEREAMIDLIIAGKRHSRKWRSGRRRDVFINRHPEYFAVPLEHAVQVGCRQTAMLQLGMDSDVGIYLNSPVRFEVGLN